MTAQDNELDDLTTELNNEHFKIALDNIVHSVLITDHEHKIIYANNSLLKLSSYKFTEIKNKFPTIFHLNLNQKKLEEFENDIDIDSKWESDVWFRDRKSTRLNSSHVAISYAVFCLKKKKIAQENILLDKRSGAV